MRVRGLQRLLAGATVGLAVLAASGPCLAEGEYTFARCDGYGRPSVAGDGMMELAATWTALFDQSTGDTDSDPVVFGALGVTQCNEALANSFLLPEYWLRRVNLLKAKAMHQIVAGDPAGALTTLDTAAAAAQANDIFYRRSEGVGLDLVRAYAMVQLGRRAEGEMLALRAWSERPFHRGMTVGALLVLAGGDNAVERERLLARLGQLDPRFRKGPKMTEFSLEPPVRAGVQALYNGLPKAETREAMLTYNMRLKRWLDFRKPWIKPRANNAEHAVWINGWGSLAQVEELALLQAAEFARTRSRDTFIILSREDVHLYQVQSYGQAPNTGTPMSITTTLQITSVDSADPDYFAPQKEYLLAADEVLASLAPVYGAGAAREWPR